MLHIICKECNERKVEIKFQKKYRRVNKVIDKTQPYRDKICRHCRMASFSANSTHFNRAIHRARTQINKAKYPEVQLLSGARIRARAKGLPFNLTKRDIVIPKFCPMLGIELKRGKGVACGSSPTLDKIIPEKGYVRGNIWVISHRANMIKNNATSEEIIRVGVALQMHVDDVPTDDNPPLSG